MTLVSMVASGAGDPGGSSSPDDVSAPSGRRIGWRASRSLLKRVPIRSSVVRAAFVITLLSVGGLAHAAALTVVTPGEQNTQSGENGCAAAPCAAGHWLHYPELLQIALGSGYAVQNNGDGGAVLGCDPNDTATAALAGGNSFCQSSMYAASIATPPAIVVIGPFGEHDQRIVGASMSNTTMLYQQAVFQAAYEGLVQRYLKYTTKIYMMTPIDLPWNAPALPAGDDLVKDIMLPAAIAVANAHGLPIIDTYTALSGTPALVTQYFDVDGQVSSAGQQKMAALVEAALASGASVAVPADSKLTLGALASLLLMSSILRIRRKDLLR
jgi:hypothetical protein